MEGSYILPLRWSTPGPIDELASYLGSLQGEVAEVVVVDGSPAELFQQHAAALEGLARHIRPHPDLSFRMGKVDGVITAIRECSHERVVLADYDIRYTPSALNRVAAM